MTLDSLSQRFIFVAVVAILVGASVADVGAATVFTATLRDGESPASGVFDVMVRAFDSRTGGAPVDQWSVLGQSVESGRLVLTLPPGAAAAEDVWLELSIRDAGNGVFEVLRDRQPVAAPGHKGAGCAVTGDLGVSGRLGVGILTPAGPLHIVGDFEPPLGLPANQNGLMMGSEATGTPSRWIQSYGANLIINPKGNRVGFGAIEAPGERVDVGGNVKADGFVFGRNAGEALRIVRGEVAADGSIQAGSGFSAIRAAPGGYTVIFSDLFSSPPTVAVSGLSGVLPVLATLVSRTDDRIFVATTEVPSGTQADHAFEFVAIGNP